MTKSIETLRHRRPLKRWAQMGVATGVAAALTLGGVSAGFAATKSSTSKATDHAGPRPPGMGIGHGPIGTVSAIGASSVTVTDDQSNSTTFTTTSSTTYKKDGKAASASDLAVGDIVSVLASSTSTASSPTASEIDIFSPSVAGTVVSVSGGVITVQDRQGFWHTVDTSASTSYELGGQSATSSAVTTGEEVMAVGAVDSDHTTLDASDVQVVLPSIMGVVKSISGDTISLTTRSGTATITTTASTVYSTHSGTGTAASVKVGSAIVAEGQESSSTALTATSIMVVPAPPAGAARGAGRPGGPGPGGPGGFGGFGGPGGLGS